jgi:hypothetical protein
LVPKIRFRLFDARGSLRPVGLAYRSDHRLGLTIVVGDGVVTVEEWRAHVSCVIGNPSWPAGRLGLIDLGRADTSAVRGGDVRELSAAFGRHGSNMAGWKGAIVAGGMAHRSAVALQQTIGPTGLVVMIFSDMASACEWLGIGVEDVAPTIEELRREIQGR